MDFSSYMFNLILQSAIKNNLESITKYLAECKYATELYGIATLLEVQLNNIIDPDELTVFRDQINKRVDQYKATQTNAEKAIHVYLDETHVLNNRSLLQWVTSGLAGAAVTVASGLVGVLSGATTKAFSLVDDLFTKQQKKQKDAFTEQSESDFNSLKDTLLLESPSSTIDSFINSVGHEVEYVKVGDDYYTNLPNALAVQC